MDNHKLEVVDKLYKTTVELLPKMYLTEMQELQYLLFKVANRLDRENEVILNEHIKSI